MCDDVVDDIKDAVDDTLDFFQDIIDETVDFFLGWLIPPVPDIHDIEKMLAYTRNKFLNLKINTNASLLTEEISHAILSDCLLYTSPSPRD